MTCSPRCWGASTRPSEPDVVHARAASNRCTTALRDLLGLVRRYWLPVGTSLNRCPRNQSAAKHAKRWPPITRRSSPSSSRTSPLRSTASAMVTSTYSTSTACCFSTPELPESYGSTATWATSRSPHATCSRRRRLIGGNAEPQGAMNAAASFRFPSVGQGLVLGGAERAPALVAVKIVRPVGRSTLTAPARRRGGWGAEAAGGVRGRRGAGSVAAAGSGCGCSEEATTGVHRSAAVDSVAAPE